MTLKQYIDNLKAFVKENPEALYYNVITAKDAEGNAFDEVYFKPSLGNFNGTDFICTDREDFDYKYTQTNSVCVN